MAIGVGESHAAAFGAYVAESSVRARGSFGGQAVDLFPKAKSMIEAAYEMDDCPIDTRINRDKLVKRDIKDKKKASEKKKILRFYVNRLDRHQGTQKYTDYEGKLNRLKQRVVLQNQSSGREERDDAPLTYDGEDLSDTILRNVSSEFDEVTEQDNALEYAAEMEDFESSLNEEEILQCEKMLLRLEKLPRGRVQGKIEEFSEKIRSLRKQILFSKNFKATLEAAKAKLRRAHGQEIKDGYNLIPKAAEIIKGVFSVGGRELSSADVVALYKDKIFCADDFFDVFLAILQINGFKIDTKLKNESVMQGDSDVLLKKSIEKLFACFANSKTIMRLCVIMAQTCAMLIRCSQVLARFCILMVIARRMIIRSYKIRMKCCKMMIESSKAFVGFYRVLMGVPNKKMRQ